MDTTDTRAALDDAINVYGEEVRDDYRFGGNSADTARTALEAAIAAHVEAEVARRLEAAPEVEAASSCPACAAPMVPRTPCAGWVDRGGGTYTLGDESMVVRGLVMTFGRSSIGVNWSLTTPGIMGVAGNHGEAGSVDAAKLAAEDALLAVRDEITRAVGR